MAALHPDLTKPGSTDRPGPAPVRRLTVLRAADFRAIVGVNEGDPLSDASNLVHEDVYALAEGAAPVRLGLSGDTAASLFRISAGSAAGRPGARVHLDSLLTFMASSGTIREALVLVEVDARNMIAEVYLHPLAPFEPGTGYILIAIDRDGARNRFMATAAPAGCPAQADPPRERQPSAGGLARALKPGAGAQLRTTGAAQGRL